MAPDVAALLASPNWLAALGLAERAACHRTLPPPRAAAARQRAGRRFARWRAQEPFAADGFFARRLAVEGVTPARLRSLLGEAPAELAAALTALNASPPWLQELAAAYAGAPPPERFPLPPEVLAASGQAPFLEAARPVLDRAFSRLLAGLEALAAASPASATPRFTPAAVAAMLSRGLTSHIQLLLGRTLVLELHLAGLDGRLAGATPEERFHSFIAYLRQPAGALEILHRYPVLARQVVETAGRWADFGLEICGHLAAADDRWRAAFSPAGEPGEVVEIASGLGDAHRGGRSVARLRFASGLQLIYKPRPMAVEAAFQELLGWCVERGFTPAFRQLKVVDCGDHGWVEAVAPAPCASAAEVERFYQRQGGFLALLFVLSATDMHHENLMAVGEHPMLLDLEALFHPLDQRFGGTAAAAELPDTVMRVGFLPDEGWGGEAGGGAGIDLSGLTATAGQLVPQTVLGLADTGTDRMRFLKRQTEMPVGGEHQPTLNDAAVPLAGYIEALIEGFVRMARLLAAHRAELAAPAGPLAPFATAPVRVLLRQTAAYAALYNDAQHPYVLGDALERERLLDLLWTVVPERPAFERLVPAEHRDLRGGDIPFFTTWPGSRDLLASDGERIADFLDESGMARVAARLDSFDEAEIERQTWLARSALLAATGRPAPSPEYELQETSGPPSAAELLEAAMAVGRSLTALAFQSGAAATWFGPDLPQDSRRWRVVPAGADLHLGVPGIALFLAFLGEIAGEPQLTALARAATVTLRSQVAAGSQLLTAVGAYSGWGGAIFALTHLGALWQDDALLDEAERIAHSLGPAIDADEHCDLVGGVAGCLVCLLGLHRLRPSPRLLDLAVRCGERLLARAVAMPQGLGWASVVAPGPPLAGFSHGAAGISWALWQLAEACGGEPRYHATALAAVAYERSLYSPTARNWPDLRAGGEAAGGGARYLNAWCHGAPGIALSRLDGLRHADSELREDAATAVATTLAGGFGRGHCLCHGDIGNLEVVQHAAAILDDPALAARAGRLAGGILADIGECGDRGERGERGWRLGLPIAAEPPGLMVGLAGVGYGLLRLAAPGRVPSVLRLEPPPSLRPPAWDSLAPARSRRER